MATIDHSGRFGDRLLITALGWQPGNQTEIEVLPIRLGAGGALGWFAVHSVLDAFHG